MGGGGVIHAFTLEIQEWFQEAETNVFRLVQLKTKSKTETVSEPKPNAFSSFQNKGIPAWDPQHRLCYSLCGRKYC